MLIGVVGSRTAGKATFSSTIVEKYGFEKIPFAYPLKKMLREGLGLTLAHTDGALKQLPCAALGGKTPVHAMQSLGTEWGRKLIGEDVWLDAWLNASQNNKQVIADDVRFHNEYKAVKERGGIIVKIRRTGVEGADAHESELYGMGFKADYEIWNDGSIDDLKHAASGFMKEFFPAIATTP